MADRWFQERRREAYYRQAKREGYRARSAYKLLQMHQKFGIVKNGHAVADLGCAPGGWSQVLADLVGPDGLVVGIDLQTVRPVAGVRFLRGDFTDKTTRDRLRDVLAERGRSTFDAVVSDMSPDLTGTYDLDQARSVHLCRLALDFAVATLAVDGTFCCKVFEGADFQEFRDEVRGRFKNVRQVHPEASRKSSSEVYLVAKRFRGKGDMETST